MCVSQLKPDPVPEKPDPDPKFCQITESRSGFNWNTRIRNPAGLMQPWNVEFPMLSLILILFHTLSSTNLQTQAQGCMYITLLTEVTKLANFKGDARISNQRKARFFWVVSSPSNL